jgi:WD40 repeat protein
LAGREGKAGTSAWNVRTGEKLSVPRGPDCIVYGITQAEGRVVLWGVSQQALVAWELLTGRVLNPFSGHRGAVLALGFGTDQRSLRSADERRVIEWNPLGLARHQFVLERRNEEDAVQFYPGMPPGILQGGFSPGGRFLAGTGSWRGKLLVRDLQPGRKRFYSDLTLYDSATALSQSAFSPDGAWLAVPGTNHRREVGVQVLDCASGEEKDWIQLGKGEGPVWAGFNPGSGTLVLAAGSDPGVRLRSWEVGRKRESPWFPPTDTSFQSISGLSCSPDGRYLLLTDTLGPSVLFEPRTGAEVRAFRGEDLTRLDTRITAFSPDGRSLAIPYGNPSYGVISRRLIVFETATGRPRWSVPLEHPEVTALAFSPEGKTLVSGHEDSSILLWDYRTLPPGASPTPPPRELASCWEALRKPDARQAFVAQRSLADAGDAAVALLRQRLRPVPGVTRDKILARLVQQLDDDSFEVRRQAFAKLQVEGPAAEAVLMQALRTEPLPEARSSIRKLLEPLWQRTPTLEQLQALRGAEVLEWIGSPAARQLVEELARGRPGDLLTREAEATLARMNR